MSSDVKLTLGVHEASTLHRLLQTVLTALARADGREKATIAVAPEDGAALRDLPHRIDYALLRGRVWVPPTIRATDAPAERD